MSGFHRASGGGASAKASCGDGATLFDILNDGEEDEFDDWEPSAAPQQPGGRLSSRHLNNKRADAAADADAASERLADRAADERPGSRSGRARDDSRQPSGRKAADGRGRRSASPPGSGSDGGRQEPSMPLHCSAPMFMGF